MPGPQPSTSSSFGATAFAGAGGQASGSNKTNDPMMSLWWFSDPFMTNPAVDGMQAVPIALPSDRLVISSGSQPGTSRDGGRMEEVTTGAHEGGPEHAARGALERPIIVPPPATGRSRRPLRPVDPAENVKRLKARLVEEGATEGAEDLCDDVFKNGVTREALETRLTRAQCRKLGIRDGKRFQIFLERVEVMGGTRSRCRLCPRNDAMVYKNHRDALRHFLKDHFGLPFECMYW